MNSAGEVDGVATVLRLFESGDPETVNYAAETIANLATVLELQVRTRNIWKHDCLSA